MCSAVVAGSLSGGARVRCGHPQRRFGHEQHNGVQPLSGSVRRRSEQVRALRRLDTQAGLLQHHGGSPPGARPQVQLSPCTTGCAVRRRRTYTRCMLFADKVWHFWLAVPIAAGAVLAVVTVLGLYAVRVTKTRYPSNDS